MGERREYFLPSDNEESVRLIAQHYLWTQHQGYQIHPDIDLPKHSPVAIADVACGNGLWILDAEDACDDTVQGTWTGFDISDAQFPSASSLPPQISFRKLDIFDIPTDLQARFDLVHVRMLGPHLHRDSSEHALRNLISLLKPGGWLQLDDADVEFDHPNAPPGTSNKCMQQLWAACRAAVVKEGTQIGWADDLTNLFRAADLSHVVQDRKPIRRTALKYWTQLQLQVVASIVKTVKERINNSSANDSSTLSLFEQAQQRVPDALREAAQGGPFCIWPKVVIGKKRNEKSIN